MAGDDSAQGSGAATVAIAGTAATGCGCLAVPFGVVTVIASVIIVGGLSVLLFPIVIIILLFSGQGGDIDALTPDEQSCEDLEKKQFSDEERADRSAKIFQGDGKGKLETSLKQAPCTVPLEFFKKINDAGKKCDAIGPVVIAAQIQYETQFNKDFVGPNGAKGISQVPNDIFAKFDKKGDPFDPRKSIDVQASYLCSLADDSQKLLDSGGAEGNVLDLTLAAYDAGFEAIREAKGVPKTSDSQSYVAGVRSWFAPMEGVGPPPRLIPPTPGLVDS